MTSAKILFVVPPDNHEAREFAGSLQRALSHRPITITNASLTSLLFETRKHDLVHFLLPASARTAQLLAKIGGRTRTVQTVLSQPASPADYKSVLFADEVVVFSDAARSVIQRSTSHKFVSVVPPCLDLVDPTKFESATTVRQQERVGERMMVVSLNDPGERKEFDSLLYITREFNRREVFRFLMPLYEARKQTFLWRERLRTSIETEKLTCASLLEENRDLHSLLDACDFALYFARTPGNQFEFPLPVVEALLRGKPVICLDRPPLNEYVKNFNARWIAKNTEDFVRESRDLQKQEARLEEISTELARYARGRFHPSNVAAAYDAIYNRLLVGHSAISK